MVATLGKDAPYSEKVHSILTVDLATRKCSARWVSRRLTVNQKHTRRTLSCSNLKGATTPTDSIFIN
ncbi:hypothetical protein CI610_02435 [invertebrate metagenome]|uniref:Uncharacterized protein n=1 Tax=invertebrate metagenome TaxID=1711999 RepID=A0A2H9T5X5_9ZZZZ